jgi:hypothetical protein
MDRPDTPLNDTTSRRLRPEAVEVVTGQPLPEDVDLAVLAEAVHFIPRAGIVGFDPMRDYHMRIWWVFTSTNGETIEQITDVPIDDFRAIQWEGFWRSGHEPVAGPSPALLDDFADQVTNRVGLGVLELVDEGLLSRIVLLIAREKAALNIGTMRQLAEAVRYPGGYQKCADAIQRLAYLGWITYDAEARLVTIGPRSYGDAVELPWEGSMSAPAWPR